MSVEGQDEIGRLGQSLESMRRNLRRQIRDQELLLETVQGMTSTPDLNRSMEILLHSVRTATGADGVRVVLAPSLRGPFPGGIPISATRARRWRRSTSGFSRGSNPSADDGRQAPWTANRNSGADEGVFDSACRMGSAR